MASLAVLPILGSTCASATDLAPLAKARTDAGSVASAQAGDGKATDAAQVLERMLPPRSDTPGDWHAPLEPLHRCGEPRLLPDCVPPPPCHPARPPRPFDLVGVAGIPTCGPMYRGPCAPRSGSHAHDHLPWLHGLHDRLFDRFYAPR